MSDLACLQIVLGVPAYGHSFHVDSSDAILSNGSIAFFAPFDKNQQPLGDSDVPGGASGTFLFSHTNCVRL